MNHLEHQTRALRGMTVCGAATLAVCCVLAAFLGGCATLGGLPSEIAPKPSEVARLRAIADAKEAAIVAPLFYRESLETVAKLQAELESSSVNATFRK